MVIREMVELQVLELVSKKLVTDSITLDIGYDRETPKSKYTGPMALDHYGRSVPKPAHGSFKLKEHTSSTKEIMDGVLNTYDRIVDRKLLVKRITLSFGNVLEEKKIKEEQYVQLDLFTNYDEAEKEKENKEKERKIQEAMLKIQGRYGKNAILKGTSLQEGATTMERNRQIGGHKA